MKVCKFGGTSMANGDAIKRVADIIESDRERRYIVVSAPGKRSENDTKVTDLLYLLKKKYDNGENFKEVFDTLKSRFCEIEKELLVNANMACELEWIKQEVENGKGIDFVASRGEYLSAKLLSSLLGIPFVDTATPIKFCGDKLDFDVTKANLHLALQTVDRAVLPGFYGSDEYGNIKTFSRGGSDITGALVANAVGAEVYENWTDVDGIYTKDPRKYSDAKLVAKLGYEEMFALSKSGANVLHKDAVFPAQQAGIAIQILNTFNPSAKGSLIE